MTKDLKEKAIQFKGKSYVLVSDRVKYFNDNYCGSITTKLISKPDADMVVVKAFVNYLDEKGLEHKFNGMSQAKWSDTQSFVNKTSALENAETSAVGRALAFMGIGVIDSIASVDEIKKTTYTSPEAVKSTIPVNTTTNTSLGKCPKCGADMKLSMQGKKYCSKLCWQNSVPDKVQEEFTAF